MFLRSTPLRFLLACLIALAPSLALAQSQASTGVIEGTVSDPSGAAVPGACRLDQEHRHQPRALPDHGRRRALPRVAPAPRPVPRHGHPQGLRHPGAGGHRADRRPVREPGPRPQRLERPGGDPRLGRLAGDRDDPDGGLDRINQAAVRGLPNNGRNFLDFTKLTPNVASSRAPTATS